MPSCLAKAVLHRLPPRSIVVLDIGGRVSASGSACLPPSPFVAAFCFVRRVSRLSVASRWLLVHRGCRLSAAVALELQLTSLDSLS